MSTENQESSVIQAVHQLKRSLHLAGESELHAQEAAALVRLMRRGFDEALEDVENETALTAQRVAVTASVQLERATSALRVGGKALQDYVRIIAPGQALIGPADPARLPTGEDLTKTRPRSVRGLVKVATENAGDVSDAVSTSHQIVQGLEGFRHDPDLSHPGTVAPASGEGYTPQPPANDTTDPLVAVAFAGVVTFEVARRFLKRLRERNRKRRENT